VKYHCYCSAFESVYTADVEADSAMEAAAKAAQHHHLHGRWVAIPGEPVHVDVRERTSYEVAQEPVP
jgi:hypothetical protein